MGFHTVSTQQLRNLVGTEIFSKIQKFEVTNAQRLRNDLNVAVVAQKVQYPFGKARYRAARNPVPSDFKPIR